MTYARRELLVGSTFAFGLGAIAACSSNSVEPAAKATSTTTTTTVESGADVSRRPEQVRSVVSASTLLVLGDDLVLRRASRPNTVELVERGAPLWDVGGTGSEPGQFLGVADAAVGPDGSFWIADTGNRRVQVLSPDGVPTRVVGAPSADARPLRRPFAVGVAQDGRSFVADAARSGVVPFAADGSSGDLIGGPGSAHPFLGISAVQVVADELVVAEALAPRVQVHTLSGRWLRTIELPTHFVTADLVVDGDDVYVVSSDGHMVRTRLDGSTKGAAVEQLGTVGAQADSLHLTPSGVIVAARPLPVGYAQ